MGLIKAAVESFKSTLADQWVEYYHCDTLSNDVLIQKGTKEVILEVVMKLLQMVVELPLTKDKQQLLLKMEK